MAIRPVSQVRQGQTNLINFSGKQKDKTTNYQSNSSATPFVKAVPLAVLIAMSPLNANSINNNHVDTEIDNIEMVDNNAIDEIQQSSSGRVIAKKEFNSVAGAQKLTVELLQNANRKSTRFTYNALGKNTVIDQNQIARYNFSLISDDGSVKRFSFKNVHSYTEQELNKEYGSPTPIIANSRAVLNYVESINKQYPNTIKTVVYNRKLAPTSGGTIQNNARGDILKNAKAKTSYGKELGAQDIDGDNGKYTVRYYSTDGNDNNVEVVTLQKHGYPELKTGLVVEHEDIISADSDLRKPFKYGQVILIDANNKSYNIVDDKLTQTMKLVKLGLTQENNAFNNAYAILLASQQYDMTPKGAFFAVD